MEFSQSFDLKTSGRGKLLPGVVVRPSANTSAAFRGRYVVHDLGSGICVTQLLLNLVAMWDFFDPNLPEHLVTVYIGSRLSGP